ncbi:DedA family protein [Cryobacterium sp. BB307]|uniref:DedA family protein n=1 Tax=Cryobacterium sp. BB307 TaxID=2716317 RepID=UPI0032C1ED4D
MQELVDWVIEAAGSPWVFPVVFALIVADAFLIVVPSETVVVALGALALSAGQPNLWVLIPIAAIAAMLGDNLTYLVGRAVGLERFGWMRRRQVASAFAWARRSLDRRAAVVMLTARFVPFGRIAVNLTAGATGFAYGRFLPLSVIAGCVWAVYNVVIGAAFGAWFSSHPVLAVVLSIVVAITLGVVVDRITAVVASRRWHL